MLKNLVSLAAVSVAYLLAPGSSNAQTIKRSFLDDDWKPRRFHASPSVRGPEEYEFVEDEINEEGDEYTEKDNLPSLLPLGIKDQLSEGEFARISKHLSLLPNYDLLSTHPDRRPTELAPLTLNRLNEALRIAITSYGQNIYPLRLEPINRSFHEMFDSDMQKAAERGFEWTARSYAFDPVQRALENSSLFLSIEERLDAFSRGTGGKFIRGMLRGLSGWENERLRNPIDTVHDGLPGVREFYPEQGWNYTPRLITRRPNIQVDYTNRPYSFGVKASAIDVQDIDQFSRPRPLAELFAERHITRHSSLFAGYVIKHDTATGEDETGISLGIYGTLKRGIWRVQGDPEKESCTLTYSLPLD
ncbi:hypothetical protein HYZ97_02090 [Candidatus Pacearchaeota archaeon]|nr:hypothetical protein [Candidatus Pacearchaeota archaeon]